MKNKIENLMKEVNKYFVDKILNKDFKLDKIERVGDSTTLIAYIKIDDKTFTLWVYSYLGSREVYCYGQPNYITLDIKPKESSKMLTIFKKIYKETEGKKQEKKERKELERLEKKYKKQRIEK